jgi:hypothetical protein
MQRSAARVVPVALLFGCIVLYAQRAQTTSAMVAGEPYRIAGVLVNAVSGEPVRRGLVQALNEGGRAVASCTTDNDGRFSLDHLEAAKYQLSASKRGFRIQSYDEHDEFATSIVTGPGQDTVHLDFRLMPNAVLFGTVTDDDGEPVANARVMLFRRPKHPGDGERTALIDGAATDDTGSYEIGNLAAGDYLLAVTAEPWYAMHDPAAAKRNSALDVVYPVTYFDSTTDEQAATPIALTGGMRQEANISLHAVPALHISVSAQRRPDGNPGGGELQQIVLGTVVGGANNYSYSTNSGILTMDGVTPGHYQFVLHGDSDRVLGVSLSSNQQLDPGSAGSASGVAGRVRMASGVAAPDQMTISLERIDDGPGQSQYATEAHQGRFRFDSVVPGEYAIWATGGDKSLPVIAVSVGATEQAGNVIPIRDRTPQVIVTLSDSQTRIEGFASKDGKGIAGAMMVLLPKNTTQWRALTRRDQSDSDGSFAFHDVAPGQYTALAIEDGWPLDWTSPAAMARYLPGGRNVIVRANSGKVMRLASPLTVEQR